MSQLRKPMSFNYLVQAVEQPTLEQLEVRFIEELRMLGCTVIKVEHLSSDLSAFEVDFGIGDKGH